MSSFRPMLSPIVPVPIALKTIVLKSTSVQTYVHIVPLPTSPFPAGSPEFTAYAACANLEANAPPPVAGRPSTLVCARLLGYMILHAPTPTGRDCISSEINSCDNSGALIEVACFYINRFVRCFRSTKSRTPAISDHPSRPSFDNVQDTFNTLLEEAPPDYRSAKQHALERDGYCCVITGRCDLKSFLSGVEVAVAVVGQGRGVPLATTQATHIFPPSTNQDIDTAENEGNEREYAAGVWAVMERFGQVNGFLELNGPNIHRLENVMTMEPNVHSFFDSLQLWFEATAVVHTYNLGAPHPSVLIGLPPTVTFTSADPNLPLPDPKYLALHAACAKVAHLSGAGEYVDTIYRDLEDMKVLASNGSSAEALSFALGQSSIAVA